MLFFELYRDHLDLHVLTHSFPTRRASDLMILRGGENIYTAAVENILCAHAAVVDASVVGLPHRTLGEEPVAAVTLGTGSSASEEELMQWASEHLAAFKCPVRIFIQTEPLPRDRKSTRLNSSH